MTALLTVALRFTFERRRIGFSTALALAEALAVAPSTISKIERGTTIPGGDLLAAFCTLGADANFILTGHRSGEALAFDVPYLREQDALDALFGSNLAHMPPAQLLGATLCAQHRGAAYRIGANPYPPRSPHHADVQIGWELAHRASETANPQAGEA